MSATTSTFEKRLSAVQAHDPVFAGEIWLFFKNNPEFTRYAHLIPMTRNPIGYGIYPFEPKQERNQRNFIEFLIHYMCESGVRATYAATQWDKMYPYLRRSNYDLLTMVEDIKDIQPKKVEQYQSLHIFLITNNIKPQELGIQHMDAIEKEVTGVGSGARAFLEQIFAADHGRNYVEYTDIGFVKGFCKLYARDVNTDDGYDYTGSVTQAKKKPTRAQIRDKIATWGDCKSIGSKMCFQIYRYGHF